MGKGEYYYGGSPQVQIAARDFGTTISIRQYSSFFESATSKRLVIRTHEYFLDLDGLGTGLLREAPGGRACGLWKVSRSSRYITLVRVGIVAPPTTAPVTKANYFQRPLVLMKGDAVDVADNLAVLDSQIKLMNRWTTDGGDVTSSDREYRAYYSDLFHCQG